MRKLLVIALVASFLGSISWAESTFVVEGLLRKSPSTGWEMMLADGSKVPMSPLTTVVEDGLNQLSENDYVRGQATAGNGSRLVLTQIDNVGLQRLIGLWESVDGIIQFLNYNKLDLISRSSAFFPFKKDRISYSIRPGENGRFSVFFADQTSVHMADLILGSDQATLEFIDAKTGDVTNIVTLNKLFSQSAEQR